MFKLLWVGFYLMGSLLIGAPWSFVVAGDGRSDGKGTRPEDTNGINFLITSEIARAVLAEKAKVRMWTGDLVLGYPSSNFQVQPDILESQLSSWLKIMQPLYDAKVVILPCRGNHDAKGINSTNIWRKIFTGQYALPQNGPSSEKGFTFFYSYENALFIGLDQYVAKGKMVDQAWLNEVIAKNKKPFIFPMAHEPAFVDGHHQKTMDTTPEKRDEFVESMISAGTKVLFFGHDHMYDHMLVQREKAGTKQEIHQIVAGTSGAPFYAAGAYDGKNSDWNLTRVKNVTNTYGYLLVTINGNEATISFKGRKAANVYEVLDSFSYRTDSVK